MGTQPLLSGTCWCVSLSTSQLGTERQEPACISALLFLMHWPCSTVEVSPRFTVNRGRSRWALSDGRPAGSAGFLWKGTGSGEGRIGD